MSARREKDVVYVGSVVRRPAAEVVEAPAPQIPGRFRYSKRPPLPHRRPHPVPPASPNSREFRVAAISTSDRDEREKYLLEEAEELARRPRSPTPPRRADDHYDLAK